MTKDSRPAPYCIGSGSPGHLTVADEEEGRELVLKQHAASEARAFQSSRFVGYLVAIIACALSTTGVLWLLYTSHDFGLLPSSSHGLENAVPNDLWAIHDLLLVGYGAVFMVQGSEGHAQVQKAAADFARLLPALHPHAPCREQLAQVLGTEAGTPAREMPPEVSIISAAQASWACLPAGFSHLGFDRPFLPQALGNFSAAAEARMTVLRDEGSLGACRGSGWPRTCSYWLSLHALAYRADAMQLGRRFLDALVPVIAGGATMCAGCTLHFRLIMDPLLSPAVRADLGQAF